MDPRTHDESHEELMTQVLTGDVEATDARVQQRAADCDDCARELEQLRDLQAALDEDARDERSARAAASTPVEGEVEVSPLLRNIADDTKDVEPGALVRWWIPAAAMAIIGASVWLAMGSGPSHDAPAVDPLPLSSDRLVLEAPDRSVHGRVTLRWSGDVGAGGWFDVWLYDADAPADAEPWQRQRDVDDTEWVLRAEDRPWPKRLRWVVEAFDVFGRSVGRLERVDSLDPL